MKRALLLLLLGLAGLSASAQRVAVQTNVLDWAALGTVNAELNVAVARHFSVMAGGRYNPWSFTGHNPECTIMNQHTTAYAGVRYWPWYVHSGWWFAAKGQWQEYANTGIWRAALKEGKGGLGGGLSLGYTYMLAKHFNLEFGAGMWVVHYKEHHFYDSPAKLSVRKEGPATFVYPDFLSVSFAYVF